MKEVSEPKEGYVLLPCFGGSGGKRPHTGERTPLSKATVESHCREDCRKPLSNATVETAVEKAVETAVDNPADAAADNAEESSGSENVEQALPILREFRLADAGDRAELFEGCRPEGRNLAQGRIVEDHVRGHPLLFSFGCTPRP